MVLMQLRGKYPWGEEGDGVQSDAKVDMFIGGLSELWNGF
jgi:hypothetical protein